MNVTPKEIELLIEALAARAARLEAYGRFNPRTAGPHDRKANAMRELRAKLMKCRHDAGINRED